MHRPILIREVVDGLNLKPGSVVVDCTVGSAGHAQAILDRILPGGLLIGIDQDEEAIARARSRLERFGMAARLIHRNFRQLEAVLDECGVEKVDGILFDLGISSEHLEAPERGFSFQTSGPLDMRMDRRMARSAQDLVNSLPLKSLDGMIRRFGEERFAHRIAKAIVTLRKRGPIATTTELSQLIVRVTGRRPHRLHPATRTFQALRIMVNDELGALEEALPQAINRLRLGGRIAVISFHSLEDRLVKQIFRRFAQSGQVHLLTRRPMRPSQVEVRANPRARSARLRIAEKVTA